ncbi:MAG: SDR family NAD(P)-dependent oxidoreductase, partial [Fimbriimonadaceae bacterium]|nr:SDR family NAD(P)-dependent oxidoreductase [Alphaproteobacteria bacterium]
MSNQPKPPETSSDNSNPYLHVAITGATSGLGWALAEYYAEPGRILSLAGRNSERLDAITLICREKGAEVQPVQIDVTDHQAMHDWLVAQDEFTP